MVPCKSTAEKVSFEWSHHRISSTDSKVRTTLHVSIIDSRIERVNWVPLNNNYVFDKLKQNQYLSLLNSSRTCVSSSLSANKEVLDSTYKHWNIQGYQSPEPSVTEARKGTDEGLSAVVGAMICLGVIICVATIIMIIILIR